MNTQPDLTDIVDLVVDEAREFISDPPAIVGAFYVNSDEPVMPLNGAEFEHELRVWLHGKHRTVLTRTEFEAVRDTLIAIAAVLC